MTSSNDSQTLAERMHARCFEWARWRDSQLADEIPKLSKLPSDSTRVLSRRIEHRTTMAVLDHLARSPAPQDGIECRDRQHQPSCLTGKLSDQTWAIEADGLVCRYARGS